MTVDASGTRKTARRIPRWLLVVLIVSLAANVFVVGSVGAAIWRFHRAPQADWVAPNLLGYSGSLGKERRHELREATAPIRERLKPLRRELRQARNELTEAITAEPFDKARFEAAQANLLAKENLTREATRALYTEIVQRLSPEERRAYGKWRERRWMPPPSPLIDDAEGFPGGMHGRRRH